MNYAEYAFIVDEEIFDFKAITYTKTDVTFGNFRY